MRVSESTFRQLEAAWGSSETAEGAEAVSWPGTLSTVRFMAVPTLFRNTLMQTRAGGALKPVDEELVAGYGLHPYPEFENPISFEMILGSGGSPFPRREEAEFKLKVLNATAGDEKHFQAWILLFPGQPAEAADFQRRLWKGGKPNDFVVCLGVNASNQIMWSRAFSWSPDRTPVKEFENWGLPGKTIDLVETVGEIESVLSKWKPTQLPTMMLEMDLKLESFPMLIMVTIIMCLLLAFGLVDDDGSE